MAGFTTGGLDQAVVPYVAHVGNLHAGLSIGLLLVLGTGGLAVAYITGANRLRSTVAGRRSLPGWRAGAFLLSLLVIEVALLPPLGLQADRYFSMHMLQHLLLALVAAPLLVLGEPVVVLPWALPRSLRPRAGRIARTARLRSLLAQPVLVWLVVTLTVWAWHSPPLYNLGAQNEAIHAVEHASFLVAACWLAATVLSMGTRRPASGLATGLLVFATMLGMALLSTLLTFSREAWYAESYQDGLGSLSPVDDQHLGGLLMWIPANAVLLASLLFVLVTCLAFEEGRDDQRGDSHVHQGSVFARVRDLLEAK